MTTIDPSAVATMQGRELDAAVAHHLMGRPSVYAWPDATFPFADIPQYSDDSTAFFAMVEKVRENGWQIDMSTEHSEDRVYWSVGLTHPAMRTSVIRVGDTLPLAFARAALLTTIPNGGAS